MLAVTTYYQPLTIRLFFLLPKKIQKYLSLNKINKETILLDLISEQLVYLQSSIGKKNMITYSTIASLKMSEQSFVISNTIRRMVK